MYRILGKHLVLEGPQFPKLFPGHKSAIVEGKMFTAVPHTKQVCDYLHKQLITVPYPFGYRTIGKNLVLEGEHFQQMFPDAKSVVLQGQAFTAIPHTVESAQLLNNMGYTVPSPILTNYAFKSKYPKPMKHQLETANFLTLNKRAYNLSDMGSAKTLSSLWSMDYLMREGIVRKCLVVSPLSTLQVVWGKEIFINFPHRTYAILHGNSETRKKLCEEQHDFYIVNHHGVGIIKENLPEDIDAIIIDELAVFRNHTTSLWENLKACIKPSMWVWGLTGTPTPNGPTDAYAQMKLITPEKYQGLSFRRCKDMMMFKLGMYKWIPRKGSEELASKMLQPSIRYDLADCVDMPETIYMERECELSQQQKHHYKEMEKDLITEISGVQVTAVNSAVLLNKLVQVAVGISYGSDKEVAKLDFGPRYNVLVECIEQSKGKVILFVPYTAALDALYDKLSKKWKVGVIDGGVSAGKRAKVFNEFQDGTEMKVLLANPSAMSHGINLIVATTTIWFAPVHSNEVYLQANARMRRPGQKNVMTIVHLFATKIEQRIYTRLKEKGDLQDLVLDLVKERE